MNVLETTSNSGLPGSGEHSFEGQAGGRNRMKCLTERIIEHPFFRNMKPEHLAILTESAKEASFKAGDVIFREGQPADGFFLIETGCIAVEAHEPGDRDALIQDIGPGEVVGWSWLFEPFTWRFGARALEPTTAIVLSGGHLLTAAECDHEFGFELMKRVAQVAIHRLQVTRKRLLEAHAHEADEDERKVIAASKILA